MHQKIIPHIPDIVQQGSYLVLKWEKDPNAICYEVLFKDYIGDAKWISFKFLEGNDHTEFIIPAGEKKADYQILAHFDDLQNTTTKKKKSSNAGVVIASTVIGGLAVGVGAVVAAPFVLAAAGFTGAGVGAGTIAASMMSSAAIANGGAIAAGSTVAVLQSAGAVGLGIAGTAAVGGAGAVVGGAVGGTVAGLASSSDTKKQEKQ